MLSLLRRLFRGAPPPLIIQQVFHGQPQNRGSGLDVYPGVDDPGDFAITRYPPFDKGIPSIAAEKILQSQQDMMDRIFRTAGVSRSDFEKYYMPAIRNLASHVHLLPATSATYFRGTGGLFRMSLEIAMNTLQSANSAVFPTGGGVERRYFMQPKWTLASFLAGLCSQNYRTVNSMAVMTRDNQQWTPLLSSLYAWCGSVKADVYFVRWMEDGHFHGAQASAAYSISQVVPHEVLQYLASDNNQVVPAMTASIAGVETNMSENPIGRLVAPVITRVIEDDLKRSATNYGHLVIGAHLEMHLVDAMRRLVRGGKWIPNNVASGSRLWVGQEGVFIDWPVAASDIANLLARDSFAGIPKDPDTLAELLVSADLLELNGRKGRYWTIALPTTLEAKEGMVKLRQGEVIFPQGFDFGPYQNVRLTLVPTKTPAAVNPVSVPTNKLPNQSASQDSFANDAKTQDATSKSNNKEEAPTPIKAVNPANGAVDVSAPESHRREKRRHKPTHTPVQSPDKGLFDQVQEKLPPSENGVTGLRIGAVAGSTAEKLLSALKPTNAWLLNEVMMSFRNTPTIKVGAVLPHGFGIIHEELNRHGIPVMELLEELGLKGWLWQDVTRNSRKIHRVDIGGEAYRMVILKSDIAAALGFDMTLKE